LDGGRVSIAIKRRTVVDSTFFGQSTGLYFYSSVFQGNMALLGVLAVFIVFRYQQIKNEINELRPLLDKMRRARLKAWEDAVLAENAKQSAQSISNLKTNAEMVERQYEEAERRMSSLSGTRIVLFSGFWVPSCLTAFVIAVSLVLLVFSNGIHNCNSACLIEPVLFGVVISLNFVALYLSMMFIRRVTLPESTLQNIVPQNTV
jgi:hypothetical protein